MKAIPTWPAAPVALACVLTFTGCGTPGAPLPPSLHLPDRVTDLAAVRSGSQVALTWTMPKRNTDKLLLSADIPVRICRDGTAGVCASAAGNLLLAPGSAGSFTDSLPADLAAGAPRPLSYFVELSNRNGRSAGLSNAAMVLAGEAPAPVAGLTAEVRKQGVVLRWANDNNGAAIRLHRALLTEQPKAGQDAGPKPQQGLLAPPPEPVEETLLVDSGLQSGQVQDQAIDKDIRFGQTYEYRAQRVARVAVGGQTVELAGAISGPVRVEATDIFPPETPTGLAAVATAADSATPASIDLSWTPVTDGDLAGYQVYRRDTGETEGSWQRISHAQLTNAPAFHDSQVQPGHSYRYTVTAVDQGGHESVRSAETEETVPNP